MPFGDWQFWIVTLLGLGGAWFIIKPFLPGKSKAGSWPSFGSGTASKKKKGKGKGIKKGYKKTVLENYRCVH